MALANRIKMGGAYIPIGADISQLQRKLKTARSALTSFSKSVAKIGAGMTAAGVAILTPLVLATKQFASVGDTLAKAGRRTGLTADAIGALGYAADLSGANIGDLERSLKKMVKTVYDAGRGLSTQKDALKKIGVKYKDLVGLKPEEQFYKISAGLESVSDTSTRAAVVQDLFGRAGTKLLPMFALGAGGIKKLREEYNLLFGSVDTKKAEDLTDSFSRLKLSVSGLSAVIGQALTPATLALTNKLTGIIINFRKIINQYPQLITGAAKIGAALTVMGSAFLSVGVITLAALSPVIVTAGLVAVAVTAIGVAAVSLLETFGVVSVGVNDTVKSMWNGIISGFQVGGRTLQGWWRVAIAGIKLTFLGLRKFIDDIFTGILNSIRKTLNLVATTAGKIGKFLGVNKKTVEQYKAAVEMVFPSRNPQNSPISEALRDKYRNALKEFTETKTKTADEGANKKTISDIFRQAKNIFSDVFKPFEMPKITTQIPKINQAATVAEKFNVSGFFGGLGGRWNEQMGGSQSIARDQLTELRSINRSISQLVSTGGRVVATYG